MCQDCVNIKDRPMTYTRCKTCGSWRRMSDPEIEIAKKPYRFNSSGEATKKY